MWLKELLLAQLLNNTKSRLDAKLWKLIIVILILASLIVALSTILITSLMSLLTMYLSYMDFSEVQTYLLTIALTASLIAAIIIFAIIYFKQINISLSQKKSNLPSIFNNCLKEFIKGYNNK